MCPATPLEAYAQEICSSAKLISGYCSVTGYSHPSFDPQAPSVTLPPNAPLNVQQARQKIIDNASRIQQLATEPSEYLPNLAVQVSLALSLQNYKYSRRDAFRVVNFFSQDHHAFFIADAAHASSTNAYPASAGYATFKFWHASRCKAPCATPMSLPSQTSQSANSEVSREWP